DTGPVSGLRCTFGYTIGGTLEDAKILTNLSDIHWPENTFFLPEKTYDPKNPKNISISHFIKKEDLYFDSAIVPKSMAHGIFLHIAYSNYPHTKEFSVIFAKELGELNFIKNHHDLEQLQFDKINVDNIGIEKLDFSQLQVDEKNRTFSGIENIGLEKLDYPKLDLSKVGLEKVGVNHDEAAQWLGKSIDFSKLISEENQNENY
ncbi:hypothetical protein KAT92_01145, partial [Candidatus Babeliales bacterium]|nr:hypothetical protein [Candidatus Babeliales bacterium]